MILDEATSALDNQTESDVLQALEIVEDCNTLVIAHRLSTIQRCDRIFEFANGKFIVSGSFEQLRKYLQVLKDWLNLITQTLSKLNA